jgi:hypothetical protein
MVLGELITGYVLAELAFEVPALALVSAIQQAATATASSLSSMAQ